MATIAVNHDCVAVTCEQRVLALRMMEPKLQVLELPSVSKNGTENGKEDSSSVVSKQSNAYVMGMDCSQCNKWLAVCSSDKKLHLWSARNWSLVSSRALVRAAEKLKFSPSGDNIIVADKSGDVYLFSVVDPQKEGLLLLGHLSMLLDVLISHDEKYIITCDRDEKIRVSHFPNAYNIQSYCLGHAEFVSCLSFLPHDEAVLVSGSGDGSVKFWNYVPGIFIDEINCQHLKVSKKSAREHTLNADATSAVMHVTCCIADVSSLLGVSLAHFKGCLIYKVSGNASKISYCIVQDILLQSEPWDLHLSCEGILWCLSCNEKEPLSAVYFDNNGRVSESKRSDKVIQILTSFNSHCEWFTCNTISERMCVLYKRKFDNVQEYLERKKMRLSL